MASKDYQIQQKLDNEMLTLHPETKAKNVLYNDNKSLGANDVQSAIDALGEKVKNIEIEGGTVTGVKGEAETEYRVGAVNITKENIGLGNVNNVAITQEQVTQIGTNKTDISNLATRVTTNETNISTAQSTADEAKLIAEGRAKAVSFDTYALMESALKSANANDYKVGDNLFIKETNVPDYWISKVNTNNSGTYGYYEISILETQKVDLSGYQEKNLTTKVTVNGVEVSTVESAIQKLGSETNFLVEGHENHSAIFNDIFNGNRQVRDSDKLDNQDGTFYLDYNNFTNTPTLEIEASGSGNFVKDITNNGHKITKTLVNITNDDLPNSGVTAGAYSVVSVNTKGIVTGGGQLVEVGTTGQETPSSSLAVGGLFFREI